MDNEIIEWLENELAPYLEIDEDSFEPVYGTDLMTYMVVGSYCNNPSPLFEAGAFARPMFELMRDGAQQNCFCILCKDGEADEDAAPMPSCPCFDLARTYDCKDHPDRGRRRF